MRLSKLERSNKAHKRLINSYQHKIFQLCIDDKNYSKSKHLELSIKRNYHANVLDYQEQRNRIADYKTKKYYFNNAVRITK